MAAVIRRLHAASAQAPRLTKLALHQPKSVEVEFVDGSTFHLSAEFLRVYSPAADSKIRSVGGEKEKKIPRCFLKGKFSVNESANYRAVQLQFMNEDFSYKNFKAVQEVIFGRRHVGIMSAESVGNYGIRILFDDLHKTGIFTWDYLHHLGSNKFSLMRSYIRTLRKHGLSRDPQRRK